MSSILNQLTKYKNDPNQKSPIITVNEQNANKSSQIDNIINYLLGIECDKNQRKEIHDKLRDFEFTKSSDRLYPKEIGAAYYLFYRFGYSIVSEQTTDIILQRFIKDVNIAGYINIYLDNINDNVRKMIALRGAAASTGQFEKTQDRIDTKHHAIFCKNAKISTLSRLNDIIDQLETTSKNSHYEDILLARIGYLMIWQNLKQPAIIDKLLN